MPQIFLCHTEHAFQNYYRERALAGLRALGEVRRNPTDHPLASDELLAAAQGCQVIVSDRNTPGDAALFARHPTLEAFVRCAMDIRTVDVAAASANGILVTRASAGFDAAVAELVIAMMVDLSRDLSANVAAYRTGQKVTIRMGRQLRGSTLGILGYGFIGRYLAELGLALGMEVLVHDPLVKIGDGKPRACGFAELLEFLATLPEKQFPKTTSKRQILRRFEEAATAVADFWVAETPTDGIPYWDTGAPGLNKLKHWQDRPADPFNDHEPVDSSAAVIAAQGLLRLGNHLRDGGGRRYRQAALTIAKHLFQEPYLSTDPKHEGLILHSVYHRPNGWDYIPPGARVPRGESSMWGDYHARELALMLLREATNQPYYKFHLP